MTAAFFLVDRDWRFSYGNGHTQRLLGVPPGGLLGADLWGGFPPALGSGFERQYRPAMADGEPTSFEAYYPEPLHAWYEVQAWPDPTGLSVYFLEVTARRRAQQQTENAARRAHLLAEVTSELTETLDGIEG